MRTTRLACLRNDIGCIDDIGSIDDTEDIGGIVQRDGAGSDRVVGDKNRSGKTISPGHVDAKGNEEYNDANIVARILKLSCYQVQPTDTNPGAQGRVDIPGNSSRTNKRSSPVRTYVHPMAITHPGHLVRHFGIQLVFLLGAQVWAAWSISSFADEYLTVGRPFHLVIALSLLMISDVCVWYSRRGKLSEKFHMPGAVLFVTAVLPIAILHLRQVLSAAD